MFGLAGQKGQEEKMKDEKPIERLKGIFLKERASGQQKLNRRAVYWSLLIALIVITFILSNFRGCGKEDTDEKIVPVEIDMVQSGSIEETIELTGWIRANNVTEVTTKVSGRIESLQLDDGGGKVVDVEEGLEVKKGDRLAVIDHDIYQAQLDSARAAFEAAGVELADAERERKRMSALYEGGSATEQSKDKAVTAAELAAANLNSAKANLELAEINLRESTIRSPIDGIVTAKHIDVGNLINIGQRIVTVADMKTVKLVVSASERYVGKIAEGTLAKVRVDAFGMKEFEADVYSVYPALDEQTHTVQVEIRLENEDLMLKPGMFAKVTLVLQQKDDVIVVPRDIVLGGKIDEPYVYIVKNGAAHKRIVRIGIIQADRCEITEGLQEGEQIVINGMYYLEDGKKVKVVKLEEVGLEKAEEVGLEQAEVEEPNTAIDL
jgi:membrane fusion protein (multidrug efflux system)